MFYFYVSDEISNLLISTGNLFKQNFISYQYLSGAGRKGRHQAAPTPASDSKLICYFELRKS